MVLEGSPSPTMDTCRRCWWRAFFMSNTVAVLFPYILASCAPQNRPPGTIHLPTAASTSDSCPQGHPSLCSRISRDRETPNVTPAADLRVIPVQIWSARSTDNRDEYFVQYLELQLDHSTGCWNALGYYPAMPVEGWSSFGTERSCPLTLPAESVARNMTRYRRRSLPL